MSKSLNEILGGPTMTGLIQKTETGIPYFLDPAFLTVTDRVIGNKASLIKVSGERQSAKLNQYGAPARRVNRRPLGESGLTMLHAFEEQGHNPMVLQNLLGLNGQINQQMAISEIDRQMVAFASRFDSLRLAATYSALRYGAIYVGTDGDVLFSSTNAAITVDFGVPAENKDQANSAITASWATATTDIPGNINTLKRRAVRKTGRPLQYAYYGSGLLNNILTNNFCKELINQTPTLAEKLYNTGEIPDGFMGLTWRPAHMAFGVDSSDAVQDWWGADTLVLCPAPSKLWWRQYEGSFLVPNDCGKIFSDVSAAAQNLSLVYGKFGYSTVTHNPAGVTQYAGDTFMPMLASPDDLYILDVVFP